MGSKQVDAMIDEMFELDRNGEPKRDAEGRPRARTSHTLNPVPLLFLGKLLGIKVRSELFLSPNGLGDLAVLLAAARGLLQHLLADLGKYQWAARWSEARQ